jgi:hypothetical protein
VALRQRIQPHGVEASGGESTLAFYIFELIYNQIRRFGRHAEWQFAGI